MMPFYLKLPFSLGIFFIPYFRHIIKAQVLQLLFPQFSNLIYQGKLFLHRRTSFLHVQTFSEESNSPYLFTINQLSIKFKQTLSLGIYDEFVSTHNRCDTHINSKRHTIIDTNMLPNTLKQK